jgi:hypothetical protein
MVLMEKLLLLQRGRAELLETDWFGRHYPYSAVMIAVLLYAIPGFAFDNGY